MPKVKVSLSIGLSNCRQSDVLDIDQEEWDSCANEEEQEKLVEGMANDWANNYIDIGMEII